ncbi:MAG TPA: formate dehydrogenase subunit gamma [Geminicoccaceae bacterium]
MIQVGLRRLSGRTVQAILILAVIGLTAMTAQAQDQGQVPGQSQGSTSDAEFWRTIRQGENFTSSLPDQQAGVLIQSEGQNWRAIRNGPLSTYGVWGLIGIVALLALFFAIRGRVRIESGRSGHLVKRFGFIERFTHWMTAVSFIVLALTGLNLLYGRYFLPDVIGSSAFGTLTLWGKYAHNYLSFAFMLGIVLMFVLWVAHNLPNRYDLIWLAKGGGMFTKHTHPPSKKFNAGQKLIFWLVVLGGASVSFSGLMLLFPFELAAFGKTFELINGIFGTELPVGLTALEEMQLAQVWHAIMGLILTIVIIAHIYIGTIGMEGAFDAMASGRVDENWAKEHHSIWAEELRRRGALDTGDD